MTKAAAVLITVFICAAAAAGLYYGIWKEPAGVFNESKAQGPRVRNNDDAASRYGAEYPNFVSAARAVTPAVVHIKTAYNVSNRRRSPLEEIYGPRGGGQAIGSGSGVCVSADGYIATNNHVVENATTIQVIFPDKRSFKGEIVGTDPNTDLALIKISGSNLPFVALGNSDDVQVGEWVLAVGYPFSLNTTVTAGIVSAKGRTLGILSQGREGSVPAAAGSAVESFIQTDAAINPGNSGGALVNTSGQLIGINAAIASMTGSYAGYSFAIPVNLAKKILNDLKEFGTVKRGYLGVSFPSPSDEDRFLRQQGINPAAVKGVFITGVQPGSAAEAAGFREGDIIQRIDGVAVQSSAEFTERVARHRPGDRIEMTYSRGGKTNNVTVTLKGGESNALTQHPETLREIYNKLGAAFAPLTDEIREYYNLKSGVVVTEVKDGGFFDQVGIPPGTIIAFINGKAIYTPEDINEALIAARNGRVEVLAIAPDGSRVAFTFSLGA